MTLIATLAGLAVTTGLLLFATSLRPVPVVPVTAGPTRSTLVTRLHATSRATRARVLIAAAAGLLVTITTGWLVMLLIVPAAVAGLPALLSAPSAKAKLERLDAIQDWSRSLSGSLATGAGLEEAIKRSTRSAPDPIRPEVERLTRRLNSYVPTGQALRQFADDLNDPTGDLLAANLIQANLLQGVPLAEILDDISASIADEVLSRRRVEADRNRPRATVRIITVVFALVLTLMFSTSYADPFRTGPGSLLLIAELTLFVTALIWLRRMSAVKDLPRFLDNHVPTGARR